MIDFILIAFMAACLEMAYQEYMKKNMIFQKWGLILRRLFDDGGMERNLSMVLGYCPYCNGFWVAVITYFTCFNRMDLFLFLFCGVNYLFIKLLVVLIKTVSHED
ncbi:MAG: hypothetical protein PHW73_00510 [Atribacterota bacterium]|nr:hypothetical protein [Atribacterota bacterium]